MIASAPTINNQLATLAEQWADQKVPYVHRGTTRTGCDCTGLIIGCVQEMGFIPGYRLRVYPRDWNLHAGAGDFIREELSVVATDVTGSTPRRGDILLFRFGKCLAHAAVCIRQGVFVHSHAAERCVRVGLLRTPKWSRRHVATWRLNPQKLEAYR